MGRPLGALLANDGACVYSVDETGVQKFTRGTSIKNNKHEVHGIPCWSLENCLPLSGVVVSGIPGYEFHVPIKLLRGGSICINISGEKVRRNLTMSSPIDKLTVSSFVQNFQPEIKDKASIYVPAVGKVTIVTLLRNLLVSSISTPFMRYEGLTSGSVS